MNTTMLLLAWAAVAPAETTETFSYDFRTGGTIPPVLNMFGRRFMKPETGGLRITLPAKRPNLAAVGVSPRFAVSGDFEISVAFEILAVEQPRKGYGSGVNIHLILDNPQAEAVTLLRGTRVKEGDVYLVNRARKRKDGRMQYRLKTFPSNATSGRLSIRRVGSVIHYLAADGVNGELMEIDQTDVGTEDLDVIRVAANTGESPTALDVRLLDLQIVSERLPNIPSPRSAVGMMWLVGGGVGVCLTVLLGVVLYYRRQAASRSAAPPKMAATEQPRVAQHKS